MQKRWSRIAKLAMITAAGSLAYTLYRYYTTAREEPRQQETLSLRKLGRFKLTLLLNNLITWNPSNDPKSPTLAFLEDMQELLHRLVQSNRCDIYLIAVVGSDREQEQMLNLLREAKCIGPNLLPEYRVLFCETMQGKRSIIRHVEPFLHIESSAFPTDAELEDNLVEISKFVPRVVYVQKREERPEKTSVKTIQKSALLPRTTSKVSLGSREPLPSSKPSTQLQFKTENIFTFDALKSIDLFN